ncbi:MAG: hypothetical protein LW809_00295 [Vampirovibrionales bacterium]|jgi:hypothetical protein|nr:hypothetical protein [Vampirovibrionales bacterium]
MTSRPLPPPTTSPIQTTLKNSEFSPIRSTRWYDNYSNLKMALHLLYLCPKGMQQVLSTRLLRDVCKQLDISLAQAQDAFKQMPACERRMNRWYDALPHLRVALALLKPLPANQIKHLAKKWHQTFGALLAEDELLAEEMPLKPL